MAVAVEDLAGLGLSSGDVGLVLTLTRGQVAGITRDYGIEFNAIRRKIGRGNAGGARRGWETRRANAR